MSPKILYSPDELANKGIPVTRKEAKDIYVKEENE